MEFYSEEEPDDEWYEDEDLLSSLVPLRADIMNGDLRSLYLGWLTYVQEMMYWEKSGDENDEEDELEPAVPPGLGKLSSSLIALADFIRIDGDLIDVAAEGSADITDQPPVDLSKWIQSLPASEKDEFLLDFLKGEKVHLRAELLRRFQQESGSAVAQRTGTSGALRTVGQLIVAAEERSEKRERERIRQREEERVRLEREKAAARVAYLDELAKKQEQAWKRVEASVQKRNPLGYNEAVALLKDLRDVSVRTGEPDSFQILLNQLRMHHMKKETFIQRLNEAKLW